MRKAEAAPGGRHQPFEVDFQVQREGGAARREIPAASQASSQAAVGPSRGAGQQSRCLGLVQTGAAAEGGVRKRSGDDTARMPQPLDLLRFQGQAGASPEGGRRRTPPFRAEQQVALHFRVFDERIFLQPVAMHKKRRRRGEGGLFRGERQPAQAGAGGNPHSPNTGLRKLRPEAMKPCFIDIPQRTSRQSQRRESGKMAAPCALLWKPSPMTKL